MNILLPTSYLPPIHYFAHILRAEKVFIELHEHFEKQTWRSRCSIYSPNGIQHLVVPLHERRDKSITKSIRISNKTGWQKNHWRSLEAAYRSSPFFEYYEDDLRAFYENEFDLLWEYNAKLLERLLGLLEIKKEANFTSTYEKEPLYATDLRDCLSKKNVLNIETPRYLQVFGNKHGFISNLSILDLLFNLGPRAGEYLNGLNPEERISS
ncbi:MAG TPA: WbqC family protein [Bacteroidia bacterium]|jgi:hypothetical protein